MKKLSVFFVVVALAIVLTGTAFAKTKITVGAFPDADRAMELLLPQFHAEYPDIEVEIISLGIDDHHTSIVNSIAAGAPLPDVVMVEVGWIARITSSAGFEDLLQPPYNAGQYKDMIIPFKWTQGLTTDGRLVAMPKDIAPATVFYRKDIFEAAGLPSEPEEVQKLFSSWEGFVDVARQLKRDTDGDGHPDHWMLADAGEIVGIMRRADSAGFFDENGEPIINRPYLVRALTIAKQIRDEGLDAKIGAWSTEWTEAIARGTTAVLMHGAWMGGHLQGWIAPDTAGLWRAVHLPENMFANDGGFFLCIPSDGKNKEAAWEFVKFITTRKESQLHMFQSSNIFPAILAAQEDPIYDEEVAFFGGQQVYRLWIEAARQAPGAPVNRFDAVAQEMLDQAVAEVLQEGADPQTALDNANEQVRRRAR